MSQGQDQTNSTSSSSSKFPAGPVYFVLGGPGSGKGTNCVRLVEEFGLNHFSAGDLLRAEAKKDTEIGQKVANIMKEGQIVPMEVTIGLLCSAMKENPNPAGYLLDGFPRKMDQALKFEEEVAVADKVLFFDLPEETMLQRIRTRADEIRAAGGEVRADDLNEETMKKRFATNVTDCTPVIEKYKEEGRLVTFDANKSKEEVYADVKKVVGSAITTSSSTNSNSVQSKPKLTLYQYPLSQPCRAVQWFLDKNGISPESINLELKTLDIFKGETQTEENTELNPFQTVPFLRIEGCDEPLVEGGAIIRYLSNIAGRDATSIPSSDPLAHARMVEALLMHETLCRNVTHQWVVKALVPKAVGAKITLKAAKAAVEASAADMLWILNWINTRLSETKNGLIAGGDSNDLSIADYLLACELTQWPLLSDLLPEKLQLKEFPHIERYLKSLESMPGYTEFLAPTSIFTQLINSPWAEEEGEQGEKVGESKKSTNQLVTESWAAVKESFTLAAVGKLFYDALFKKAPVLKDTLFKDVNMEQQGLVLLKTVDVAVSLLDQPEELVPVLIELGERHAGYGAEEPHYGVVGEVFLATLAKGLGDLFTDEVKAAWTEVYGVISSKMLEGQASEKGRENAAAFAKKSEKEEAEKKEEDRTAATEETTTGPSSSSISGLEVVFKYAHHSQMMPDLSGLNMLKNACNEMNVARYVESPLNPGARGWTPNAIPGVGNPNVDSTSTGAVAAVTESDLSRLDQAMEEAVGGNAADSTTTAQRYVPKKPPTPDVKVPLPPGEGQPGPRVAAPTSVFALPALSTAEGSGDYVYQPRSTHGSALSFVFNFTMREQARQKLIAAKERKLNSQELMSRTVAAVTIANPTDDHYQADDVSTEEQQLLVHPFFGLSILHATCVQVKQLEPHKLMRFPLTAWNSAATRYQHERLLMGAHNNSGGRTTRKFGQRGSQHQPSSPSNTTSRPPMPVPKEAFTGVNDYSASVMSVTVPFDSQGPPQPPSVPRGGGEDGVVDGSDRKRPTRRVNTAQRIARRAENLKTTLTEVKQMIDARAHASKFQHSSTIGSGTLRARRIKKFAATLPKPQSSQQQARGAKQQQQSFLPSIHSGGGSGGGAEFKPGDTLGSVGGEERERIRLPTLANRTQGDGSNVPQGRGNNAPESRAGRLVKQFEADGIDVGGGTGRHSSPPGSPPGSRGVLKGVRHRFTSGPTQNSSASNAKAEATARKLMMTY